MVAMIEVLFDFRDHAHRGLDGDREARTGRRRSASPQRSEGRQAARFLFPRGMREEQGKKRAACRCGQSLEPKALQARSAIEEAEWDVVGVKRTVATGNLRAPGS
jgi:hypothetical protein